MSSTKSIDLSRVRLGLEGAAGRISGTGYALGVLGLLATGVLMTSGTDPHMMERGLLSYLVNWVFFLSLSVGALFFVLIQHATKAGWSVTVRRLAEAFSANFLLLAVLGVPLLLYVGTLFEWAKPEVVAHDALLQGKEPYLNKPFFYARMAGYFVIWILLSRFFFTNSVKQDAGGQDGLSDKMTKVSYPGLYLFAFTVTFFSFDLLMSLEPHWFSTIFGVYFFAGSALGCFALLPLTAFLLQRSGRLEGVISTEHYHDLGKLMFAFVVFWAYIGFSQYMLIWYANIPEETGWYLTRITGQWKWFSWFIFLGHFLVPFLSLISRVPKRHPGILILGSVYLLAAHWGDIYWLAMPHISPDVVPFHILDLTAFLGVGGLWVGAFATRMRDTSLLAKNDPRLPESLAFENF